MRVTCTRCQYMSWQTAKNSHTYSWWRALLNALLTAARPSLSTAWSTSLTSRGKRPLTQLTSTWVAWENGCSVSATITCRLTSTPADTSSWRRMKTFHWLDWGSSDSCQWSIHREPPFRTPSPSADLQASRYSDNCCRPIVVISVVLLVVVVIIIVIVVVVVWIVIVSTYYGVG